MASTTQVVSEAGRMLNLTLRPERKTAFGLLEGFPLQLLPGKEGNQECVLEIIRLPDASQDAELQKSLKASPALKGLKGIKVDGGLVLHKRLRPFFRSVKPEIVAEDCRALVAALKVPVPVFPAQCRLCKGPADLLLLNGVVDRVCPACVQTMRAKAGEAMKAYEDIPVNIPLAVLASAGLAVAGAVAWAGIAAATDHMFWILAIGIGALIGWGTVKAAGKGGHEIQALVGFFTIVSVLLGQVLFIGWVIHQQAAAKGAPVNWGAFVLAIPSLLWATGFTTLFALGGGIFGALRAIQMAAKPDLKVEAEPA